MLELALEDTPVEEQVLPAQTVDARASGNGAEEGELEPQPGIISEQVIG